MSRPVWGVWIETIAHYQGPSQDGQSRPVGGVWIDLFASDLCCSFLISTPTESIKAQVLMIILKTIKLIT